MKFEPKDPPREYSCGVKEPVTLSDCGDLYLEADEQITVVHGTGYRHDVTAKNWGFYATQSINSRVAEQGVRTALVRNPQGRYYIMCVSETKMTEFNEYLEESGNAIVEWLNDRI